LIESMIDISFSNLFPKLLINFENGLRVFMGGSHVNLDGNYWYYKKGFFLGWF
jgi:hypothetical protein